MADTAKIPYRINLFKGGLMVGIAAIAEALQAVVDFSVAFALGADFIAILVEGGIAVTFFLNGVQITSGKKAFSKFFTVVITWIIELIPFINALPGMTVSTVMLIRTSREEDREKFKKAQEETQKKQQAQQQAALQQQMQAHQIQALQEAA